MNPTDGDLVAWALAGDTAAFAELFERHRTGVGRICCSYVGRGDADDLAQMAFLMAFERLGQLRQADQFGAWLRSIARSACLMWLRRRRLEAAALETAYRAGYPAPAVDALVPWSMGGVVRAALARLPAEEAAAVALFHIHGYSYQEIAEQLGVPAATIRGRLSRGRQRLRPLLAEVCAPASPPREKRERSTMAERSKTPGQRILISDDSPVVVRLLMVNLLHRGYDALGTTWALQTLELARSWQPALVITDLHKGRRLDGFRIIRSLKADEQTRHIPVLVVSADAAKPVHAERARACGAARVLAKPFDPEELLNTVNELLSSV